jgi:hypothetical protein
LARVDWSITNACCASRTGGESGGAAEVRTLDCSLTQAATAVISSRERAPTATGARPPSSPVSRSALNSAVEGLRTATPAGCARHWLGCSPEARQDDDLTIGLARLGRAGAVHPRANRRSKTDLIALKALFNRARTVAQR